MGAATARPDRGRAAVRRRPVVPRRRCPPLPGGDAGTSLMELVVALTILAIVLGSASLVLAGSVRAGAGNRRADTAQRLATQAIELATAFDCGILPPVATTAVLDRQQTRCGGSLGSRAWTTTVAGTTFAVRFDVSWVLVSPNSGVAATCDRVRVQRTVTVSWTESGQTRTRRSETLATMPYDSIANLSAGQVLATGVPDRLLGLVLPTGHRYPLTTDAVGAARFPFLAGGVTYTVRDEVTGAVRVSPVVPVNPTDCTPVAVTM